MLSLSRRPGEPQSRQSPVIPITRENRGEMPGGRQIEETNAAVGSAGDLIRAPLRALRQGVQQLDQATAEIVHTAQADTATKKYPRLR